MTDDGGGGPVVVWHGEEDVMRVWGPAIGGWLVIGCVEPGESPFTSGDRGGYLESSTGGRCDLPDDGMLGTCLDGPSAFAISGGDDCPGAMYATVWLSPGVPVDGSTYTLQPSSTPARGSEGAVWFDEGTSTWTTASGSATAWTDGASVAVEFEADTLDFLTETEPGPSISGLLWCTL